MILPIGTVTVGLPLKKSQQLSVRDCLVRDFFEGFFRDMVLCTCTLLKCATYARRRNSGLFNQQVHT
jgi:hypothetical protein